MERILLHPDPAIRKTTEGHGLWPAQRDLWMNEYQPDTATYEQQVLHAAAANLEYRLEQERYDSLKFAECPEDEESHKLAKRFAWHLDRAERRALRLHSHVERIRRSRLTDDARKAKAIPSRPASKTGGSSTSKPKALIEGPRQASQIPASAFPYLQIIEVRVENGVTKTNFNPPNRNLVAMLRQMNRPNQSVRRILNLPETLPPEYAWAETENGLNPGKIDWCVPEDRFVADVEEEELSGTGHVLRTTGKPVREIRLLG